MDSDLAHETSQPPIVMRWKETVSGGDKTWFVIIAESSDQFWGYVHVRTVDVFVNRTFLGELDRLKISRIHEIVARIRRDVEATGCLESAKGILGLGSRSQFTPLIKFRKGATDAEAFLEIVSIILPELRLATDTME